MGLLPIEVPPSGVSVLATGGAAGSKDVGLGAKRTAQGDASLKGECGGYEDANLGAKHIGLENVVNLEGERFGCEGTDQGHLPGFPP